VRRIAEPRSVAYASRSVEDFGVDFMVEDAVRGLQSS